MNTKAMVSKLLKSTKLATISTIDAANLHPESALIAFVEDNTLKLYFQTGNDTRKYKNLQACARVALVVGFEKVTLQYEGIAKEVNDSLKVEYIKQLFLRKNSPTTATFFNRPDISFFEIEPTWIGYSDYTHPKPLVAELIKF